MAWLGHSVKWGSPSAKLEDSHSPKPVAEELAQGLLLLSCLPWEGVISQSLLFRTLCRKQKKKNEAGKVGVRVKILPYLTLIFWNLDFCLSLLAPSTA